jgi:hypothetical protein
VSRTSIYFKSSGLDQFDSKGLAVTFCAMVCGEAGTTSEGRRAGLDHEMKLLESLKVAGARESHEDFGGLCDHH